MRCRWWRGAWLPWRLRCRFGGWLIALGVFLHTKTTMQIIPAKNIRPASTLSNFVIRSKRPPAASMYMVFSLVCLIAFCIAVALLRKENKMQETLIAHSTHDASSQCVAIKASLYATSFRKVNESPRAPPESAMTALS